MFIILQMECAEKVEKWQFFGLFQTRPSVCELQYARGIARILQRNRSPEFAGKIKIFPANSMYTAPINDWWAQNNLKV